MSLWPESIIFVSFYELSHLPIYSVINRFPPFLLEKGAVTVLKACDREKHWPASVFGVLLSVLESPEPLLSLLDLNVVLFLLFLAIKLRKHLCILAWTAHIHKSVWNMSVLGLFALNGWENITFENLKKRQNKHALYQLCHSIKSSNRV